MYIYRYFSGQRRHGKIKPMLIIYFVSPDYPHEYEDCCILTEHSTIAERGTLFSHLRSRGGEEFAYQALEDHFWNEIDTIDVPERLLENQCLEADQKPREGKWFRAKVPGSFIEKLEDDVDSLPPEIRHPKPAGKSGSPKNLVLIILVLLVACAGTLTYQNL